MKNEYYIKGKYCFILINSKRFGKLECKVDLEDFDKINSIKGSWYAYGRSGSNRLDGISTKIQKNKMRKIVILHRFLVPCSDEFVIDHIDGNVLNNSKSNLRIATFSENSLNKKPTSDNLSNYTNIYIEKDNRYAIRIQNKRYGRYDTIEKALEIRNKIYKKYYKFKRIK